MKFSHGSHANKSRKKTIIIVVFLLIVAVVVGAALYVRKAYQDNLQPVSTVSKTHVVTIEPGATTSEIADQLKNKGVIKSDWAFEWYVRNEQVRDQLKAGTFVVDENQSVEEIVQIIVGGKVATDLVTILPGKTITEIKQGLIEDGFPRSQVNSALEPEQYRNHPALTDKPAGASLEGYLYPETFQKTAETTVKQIVLLSLDEMQNRLTSEVRQAIAEQGLTLHEGLILASIIEGEVSSPEDRAKVSQVFLKRLRESIRLESNATDDYSETDPTYDTYKIDGLPPGPISNFTETSIEAVAFPAKTDWLFFVSGDNGVNHFSKTLEEHEENIVKYCTDLCGR